VGKDSRLTYGIDVGDRWSRVAVVDDQGEVVQQFRVRTTPAAVEREFAGRPPSVIALETGAHSPWMSRLLQRLGHDVVVADARQVRLIFGSKTKTDKLDAVRLAKLARADRSLLHPVQHRPAQVQADLALLRARDLVVRLRTATVNAVRGLLKPHGWRAPSCTPAALPRKLRASLPPHLQPALAPLLVLLEEQTRTIRHYDREIRDLGTERYPVTQLLRQVPGVGPLTALAFVLVIVDPQRFRKARQVGAYVGLCPKIDQSGTQDLPLRITRAGSPLLRRLLVQSAHYILGPFGPDCELRRFGERLADRGSRIAKRKAVVAVARKLALLLYRLWRTGEVYRPLPRAEAVQLVS